MLLIKNGLVVDPTTNICQKMDLLIEEGKIKELAEEIEAEKGETIIDASNKIVAPGFIDMHVHLREPGQEYKETILTGCQAAAKGGFTSIACMPNTDPVVDTESAVEMIKWRAQKYNLVDVYPIASITKGQKGKELSEYGILKRFGAVAFSDDGKTVKDTGVMRRAFDYAKAFGALIITHCEDSDLAGAGVMHEGEVSTYLGLPGIPSAAEEIIITREIALAELTGGNLHICHVSTKKGVELIREAKKRGIKVTAEATPHHFILDHTAVKGYDPNTKVNPPLRTKEDIEEIIKGLKDGTLDCIVTDHAPHALYEKEVEFISAPFGISGLETAVPLAWNFLYQTKKLTLVELVKCFSTNPARILGLDRGSLQKGKIADITIIDPQLTRTVNKEKFYSLGKNTPFDGWELKGWPIYTIKNGEIIMDNGIVRE